MNWTWKLDRWVAHRCGLLVVPPWLVQEWLEQAQRNVVQANEHEDCGRVEAALRCVMRGRRATWRAAGACRR